MKSDSKKILIICAIVVVVFLISVVAFIMSRSNNNIANNATGNSVNVPENYNAQEPKDEEEKIPNKIIEK